MNAMKWLAPAAALAMAWSVPADAGKPTAAAPDPMQASAWEIGPVIGKRNSSVNMPATPSTHADGWSFAFPQPDKEAGHVHYLTFKHGPLTGKSRIVMRYRIDAGPDVQLYPTNFPGRPSTIAMYFQRRGDNWSGKGKFETYRWWATFRAMTLAPGEYELSVGLDENWTAIQTSSAATNPAAFAEAIRDAERVGFTFGGGDGYGHGVYATGPAVFVVTHFEVVSDTDFGIRSAP